MFVKYIAHAHIAAELKAYLMFALHGFLDEEEVEFPVLCHLEAREFT